MAVLKEATVSTDPSERYWAVTWLGVNKEKSAQSLVESLTKDNDGSVRVAANLALYKIDSGYNPIPSLAREIDNNNFY